MKIHIVNKGKGGNTTATISTDSKNIVTAITGHILILIDQSVTSNELHTELKKYVVGFQNSLGLTDKEMVAACCDDSINSTSTYRQQYKGFDSDMYRDKTPSILSLLNLIINLNRKEV